eukprot:3651899-Prymnesium_polylepis.2
MFSFSSFVKLICDVSRARLRGAQLHRWSCCTISGSDSAGWYRTTRASFDRVVSHDRSRRGRRVSHPSATFAV